jgi:hypothetical protein
MPATDAFKPVPRWREGRRPGVCPSASASDSAAALVLCALLAGCAVRLPDTVRSTQPALITLSDSSGEAGGVQLIVLGIDGAVPPKAGPYIDPTKGGPADRSYEPGTVIASPPLRPARSDFAVEPGKRELSLVFGMPGRDWLNLLAVTRAKGSEATGVRIEVQPGCQYQLAAKLTVLSGREIRPEVRWVRPIPAQYGLPAAARCPAPRDVPLELIRN